MHIMLTNDDGIQAAGLWAMCRALAEAGHRIDVFAPDRPRSAASHALTIATPICATPYPAADARAWAVDGTPVDCAKLGLYMLEDDPVDMVISGINRGANLGAACVYSGTVAAALEAAMAGWPALATSLDSFVGEEYACAARVSARVADWISEHPLPRGVCYNLNVPALPYERIRGVRRARLASQFLIKPRYEKRVSPLGHAYYWLTDAATTDRDQRETDESLVREGYATLSALTWDMLWPGEMCAPEGIL